MEEIYKQGFEAGRKYREEDKQPSRIEEKEGIIIEEVCKYFEVNLELLRRRKRNRYIVEPRQVCMYFLSKYTKISLKEIGEKLGGYDHTTVIHAKNTISNLIATGNQVIVEAVCAIEIVIIEKCGLVTNPYKANFSQTQTHYPGHPGKRVFV